LCPNSKGAEDKDQQRLRIRERMVNSGLPEMVVETVPIYVFTGQSN